VHDMFAMGHTLLTHTNQFLHYFGGLSMMKLPKNKVDNEL
jgi:hypothetical protein